MKNLFPTLIAGTSPLLSRSYLWFTPNRVSFTDSRDRVTLSPRHRCHRHHTPRPRIGTISPRKENVRETLTCGVPPKNV
jgi:hypothetical protein